jgi:hypothetical protein
MSLQRKLKPDNNITGAAVPLSMLPLFGIASLIFGLQVGMRVLMAMIAAFALFYLFVSLRTGNRAFLFVFVYAVFLSAMLYVGETYFGGRRYASREFGLAYFTGIAFFGAGLIYLLLTRKTKWRGREVLELAAEPVEESGNGYTARPRPVGRVEYTPEQIHGFARFISSNLIALPYKTSKNVTLVPVRMGDEYGRLLGLSGDYLDATWVNFDLSGEVSVHIAQKDYLNYREPLAFDQLCSSLGQLFIDFFELYRKGEGVRVIDRMNDLNINVFS